MTTPQRPVNDKPVQRATAFNTAMAVCVCTIGVLALLFVLSGCGPTGRDIADDDGFMPLFDGKTLTGWEGDSTYWHVEHGSIVGVVTPATLLERNSFLIWQGDMPEDFELRVVYRISEEGNSGINYRSERVEGVPYALSGYQADLDGAKRYIGSNYEERRRTTLASLGEKVVVPPIDEADELEAHIESNQWTEAMVQASLGDPDSLRTHVKDGKWNEYHIIAKGNHLQHYVNDVLMSEVIDNDTVNRSFDGWLGVQVHVGPPMKVEYRSIRLKELTNE